MASKKQVPVVSWTKITGEDESIVDFEFQPTRRPGVSEEINETYDV